MESLEKTIEIFEWEQSQVEMNTECSITGVSSTILYNPIVRQKCGHVRISHSARNRRELRINN